MEIPEGLLAEGRETSSTSHSSRDKSERSSRSSGKRKRSEQERRDRHNDTERKGRQKINNEINSLKDLLPELQNAVSPKANVLQCAVDNIKRLQALCQQLLNTNMHLKDENKKLWAEVNRLRAVLNPHDSLLCEILEQKLGQSDSESFFPGPLPPPPVAPMSVSSSSLSSHDICMRNNELVMGGGSVMGFPTIATTRPMWCYSN